MSVAEGECALRGVTCLASLAARRTCSAALRWCPFSCLHCDSRCSLTRWKPAESAKKPNARQWRYTLMKTQHLVNYPEVIRLYCAALEYWNVTSFQWAYFSGVKVNNWRRYCKQFKYRFLGIMLMLMLWSGGLVQW